MIGPLRDEPVRVYAGGLVVAAVAVLLVYGLVDGEQAAAWIALGTALVGVPAVEKARSKVTPVSENDELTDMPDEDMSGNESL